MYNNLNLTDNSRNATVCIGRKDNEDRVDAHNAGPKSDLNSCHIVLHRPSMNEEVTIMERTKTGPRMMRSIMT